MSRSCSIGLSFLAAALSVGGSAVAQTELPDIRSIAPDLSVPSLTTETPAAGKRVRLTTSGWEQTRVYHALYLPENWSPGATWPLVVEWPGNGGFRSPYGDECTGLPEGCNLGYGLTAGRDAIWVSMPFLNAAGNGIAEKWWGDAPAYDPQPTLAYLRATVAETCRRFGADPSRVILAGFSRGSIATNRLGLADEETAGMWRGFVCYSHYDGVREKWPYPEADRPSALARLERLHGRPQFICGEGSNAEETRQYLAALPIFAGRLPPSFTFASTGFRNHNDAWILRPSDTREKLREWFRKVVK